MVIEDMAGQLARSIPVREIPQGQVFTGAIEGYADTTFLKSYASVVSLSDPMNEWTGTSSLKVSNYVPRDAKVVLL